VIFFMHHQSSFFPPTVTSECRIYPGDLQHRSHRFPDEEPELIDHEDRAKHSCTQKSGIVKESQERERMKDGTEKN